VAWQSIILEQAMKTTVSIPDEIFRRAESVARQLRVSRNKLYTIAITQFIDLHRHDAITQRLNEVYSRQTARVDPALFRTQMRSLRVA
jgi:metal-responsive CopG/Arc/MetJ family transcriptional regulator